MVAGTAASNCLFPVDGLVRDVGIIWDKTWNQYKPDNKYNIKDHLPDEYKFFYEGVNILVSFANIGTNVRKLLKEGYSEVTINQFIVTTTPDVLNSLDSYDKLKQAVDTHLESGASTIPKPKVTPNKFKPLEPRSQPDGIDESGNSVYY